MNSPLSELRNQFFLISSIAFVVTAGKSGDLPIDPPIEMRALTELVRAKPRSPGKIPAPGATKRERIVVPALESIEGSAGLIPGEPLPKILVTLKNSGKKLVNVRFNHISFSLYAKGYDGIQIKLPNDECLDCGPKFDSSHDPPYGLHKTSHQNIDKFSGDKFSGTDSSYFDASFRDTTTVSPLALTR